MRKADKWQPPARFNVLTRGWSDKRLRALAYVIGVMLYGDGYTSISLGRRESGNRVEFHGSYNLIITAKPKRLLELIVRRRRGSV